MYHIGLSTEEIERVRTLIARLDAEPLGDGADRRVHPRIDFSHPMWINLPTEAGKPWVHIFSRNLSTGGLAFLTKKIFYLGQHLIISHELKEEIPLLVLCKVRYCRVVDEKHSGIQEVGLAFTAVEPDPLRLRRVPAHWLTMVLQNDWITRRKMPLAS